MAVAVTPLWQMYEWWIFNQGNNTCAIWNLDEWTVKKMNIFIYSLFHSWFVHNTKYIVDTQLISSIPVRDTGLFFKKNIKTNQTRVGRYKIGR
jgi:hypothetical protein